MTKTRAKAKSATISGLGEMDRKIDQIGNQLEKQLEQLRDSVSGCRSDTGDAEDAESGLRAAIASFQSNMNEALNGLRIEVAEIRTTIEHQNEGLRRRYNEGFIILHGVKEERGKTIYESVCSLLTHKVGIEVSPTDLSVCYRLGKKSPIADMARPLAVQFVHRWKRDKVFSEKKRLKGSGIVMFEMLTRATLDLFKKVKQKVGAAKCWTWRGTVFAFINNSKQRILREEDLSSLN